MKNSPSSEERKDKGKTLKDIRSSGGEECKTDKKI